MTDLVLLLLVSDCFLMVSFLYSKNKNKKFDILVSMAAIEAVS